MKFKWKTYAQWLSQWVSKGGTEPGHYSPVAEAAFEAGREVEFQGDRAEAPPEQAKTTGLNFGDALKALKEGKRVAREGWNGKNMWLIYVPGSPQLTVEEGRPLHRAGLPVGTEFSYNAHVDMFTVQKTLVPWLCSMTDMLAEDWCVVQ